MLSCFWTVCGRGVWITQKTRDRDLLRSGFRRVGGVHNLHVWELAPGQVALSAHLDLSDLHQWPSILEQTVAVLSDMGVDHITLQPEVSESSAWPHPQEGKVQ